MERIADASLSVLIPIHNSTWIEFLTNGEGRQVIRRFGGRHIKFGTLCPWARGQAPNHISCDIRRCHCQTRKELQRIPNLPRTMPQSVGVPKRLGFLWSGGWADFSAAGQSGFLACY